MACHACRRGGQLRAAPSAAARPAARGRRAGTQNMKLGRGRAAPGHKIAPAFVIRLLPPSAAGSTAWVSPGISEASRRRLTARAGAPAPRAQRQPRGGKRGCESDTIERLAFFSLGQHTCLLPINTSMAAPRARGAWGEVNVIVGSGVAEAAEVCVCVSVEGGEISRFSPGFGGLPIGKYGPGG